MQVAFLSFLHPQVDTVQGSVVSGCWRRPWESGPTYLVTPEVAQRPQSICRHSCFHFAWISSNYFAKLFLYLLYLYNLRVEEMWLVCLHMWYRSICACDHPSEVESSFESRVWEHRVSFVGELYVLLIRSKLREDKNWRDATWVSFCLVATIHHCLVLEMCRPHEVECLTSWNIITSVCWHSN